ncbi:hypothetical protein IHE45_05G215100 [Dioscorea alata]|uniref:Uncharacterized protein n=1 Tax=Dioscorea alata TaxID=55571 RepID=A0ACB7W9B8_DIOAL|nr:hypothetical protein IHE45_05G215100 [Dioscorea alata]
MAKLIQQLKNKFFNFFDRVKGVNNTNSKDKGGGDNHKMSHAHVQSRGISITTVKQSDRPKPSHGPPPQTN